MVVCLCVAVQPMGVIFTGASCSALATLVKTLCKKESISLDSLCELLYTATGGFVILFFCCSLWFQFPDVNPASARSIMPLPATSLSFFSSVFTEGGQTVISKNQIKQTAQCCKDQ